MGTTVSLKFACLGRVAKVIPSHALSSLPSCASLSLFSFYSLFLPREAGLREPY